MGALRIENASEWGILSGYSYENDGIKRLKDPSSQYITSRILRDGVVYNQEYAGNQMYRRQYPWHQFDRFYSVDLDREVPSGRHYVFMCRPDLYLIKEGTSTNDVIELASESRVSADPYFLYLAKMHPEIIASLTGDFGGFQIKGSKLSNTASAAASGSGYGNSRTTDGSRILSRNMELTIHTFIPYITGRVESLQLPDYTVKQNNLVQPYTHYSIPYTQSAIDMSTGGTFELELRDDKYYSLTKLFYAWIYYEDGVMRDRFKPKKKYLMYNSIDYATSIYDFIVDETGENIIYWAKYTGCVPTSVPISNLSFNRGNSTPDAKTSISFSYFYVEHMDMNILRDFQYNSLGYIAMKKLSGNQFNPVKFSDTEPIYNNDTMIGQNYVGRPVILITGDPQRTIKLRWLKSNLN